MIMTTTRSWIAYVSYGTMRALPLATATALATAGRQMTTKVITGTILALAPRPIPNAERRLCQYRARMIWTRPSRRPVYRRYPMSWMTPVSADMGSLRRLAVRCLLVLGLLVSEQLLDPASPLLQPVERKAEIRDRVADGVVRAVAG